MYLNIEEQIEKAFKAGADFVIDECYCEEGSDLVECPNGNQIDIACTEYINGNLKSSTS